MKYKRFFIMMFLCVFLGIAASLVGPFLLSLWSNDEMGFNGLRLLILFLALMVSMCVEIMVVVVREKYAKHYNIENFRKFLQRFLAMDYDSIIEKGPANLIQRVQGAVNDLYTFMTGSFISIWSNSLALIIILVVVTGQNWMAGVIMFAMAPTNYFGYKLLNKELMRRSKKLQENSAAGYQQVLSYVEQTNYLKQCGDYDNMFRQMAPAFEMLYGSMADVNIFAQSVSLALKSLNRIAQTLSMAVIVWQYDGAVGNMVSLVLVTVLFPLYFSYLSSVTNANLSKQGLKVSMDFVAEMDSQAEEDGEEELEEIRSVKFAVRELAIGERVLARNIVGDFEKGDVVWIKGASGTGKSTLVKLLAKFRTCDKIEINGKDIRRFTNASLRRKVDYLSQNIPIVTGSVRDNLSFNQVWDKKNEECLAKQPFFAGFLQNHGYDSRIEENGANLSGGEKQKIALARIFFDEVDMLILDEFTSNIDKGTAEEILDTVVKNGKEKILFIISHDELPEKYATKTLCLNS